ncbi:MAG: XRE family transcriptional regulator [Rhodospirillaceae bacterium]|nr:XRE family transcriptional regulator [Rhodospirillaceae bacterium]
MLKLDKLQRKLNTDDRDESAHGPISLGTHVRGIRNAAGLTLSEISKRSGLSVSAISKIERDQISPTFFNLMRLAEAYGIHIADLVSTKQPEETVTARLAVTRKSERSFTEADQYSMASLCGNLEQKRMKPLINRVSPEDPNNPVENIAHHGEEFIYVISGKVQIRTDFYQPIYLEEGDSIYFDSSMPHAFVSASDEDAEICAIWLPAEGHNHVEVEQEFENVVRLRQPLNTKK